MCAVKFIFTEIFFIIIDLSCKQAKSFLFIRFNMCIVYDVYYKRNYCFSKNLLTRRIASYNSNEYCILIYLAKCEVDKNESKRCKLTFNTILFVITIYRLIIIRNKLR